MDHRQKFRSELKKGEPSYGSLFVGKLIGFIMNIVLQLLVKIYLNQLKIH